MTTDTIHGKPNHRNAPNVAGIKENNKTYKSSWVNAGVSFFRRISVFYLFFALSLVFWLLYNYRYIPSNKEELNERGQRVLNQLTKNFLQKDQELKNTFTKINDRDTLNLYNKKESFGQLDDNIHYEIGSLLIDNPTFFPLDRDSGGKWKLLYKASTGKRVEIEMEDFLRPLLSGQKDVFKSYMLLLEDSDTRKSSDLQVVYRQDVITLSQYLDADTIFKLRKNSDFSSVTEISISGRAYMVFFSPFDFYQNHMIMAGLLPKSDYIEMVTTTPLHFIPASIIIILLIFIFLPFVKTFLLSSRESINSKDVLYAATSFYLGSAALCLIVFYVFMIYITGLTFEYRLRDFGDKIHSDIELELNQASNQLKYYESLEFTAGEQDTLTRPNLVLTDTGKLNKMFLPSLYKNTFRVFWADSKGNTLAKWHPFNFTVPLTKVESQDFFIQYKTMSRGFRRTNSITSTLVSAGKSNATNEFFTLITSASGKKFHDDSSSIIAMGISLNASMHPVIPQGFGFSLIDRNGRILFDAQEQRNLSGNITSESGDDPALAEAMKRKNPDLVFGIQLYGTPYVARVIPLKSRPFYLVTYYNKRILFNNILRLLHFTIQSLLYLFIVVGSCLLIAAYETSHPARLRFKLNKIEWIRPSTIKNEAHFFTFIYFLFLFLAGIVYYILSLAYNTYLNGIFYMALLLPLYTIWGFIISRKKAAEDKANEGTRNSGKGWDYVLTVLWKSILPFLFILLMNFIIVSLLRNTIDEEYSFTLLFSFQVLVIVFLLICSFRHPIKWFRWNKHLMTGINSYLYSLFLSVMLIGVLPTVSILTYGFFSEKMQYKKEKLINILSNFQSRSRYLQRDLIPNFRPNTINQYDSLYFDDLLKKKGIYLTDQDSILFPAPGRSDSGWSKTGLQTDNLYSLLMNKLYLLSPEPEPYFSIKSRAGDTSWYFTVKENQTISVIGINARMTTGKEPVTVRIQSSLQNPFHDIMNLPRPIRLTFIIFTLILVISAMWLIKGVISRLFLSEYSFEDKIAIDEAYLKKYFIRELPKANYLKNFKFPLIIEPVKKPAFFENEFLNKPDASLSCSQEEYIIAMTQSFADIYEKIWQDLPREEKYTLFDFSQDRFTNYKSSDILFSLIHKGILKTHDENLNLFSLSFRNYILSKKGNSQIRRLRRLYSIPGTWDSIRIPVLSVIAVVALFILVTQTEFTRTLTTILTSAAALFPLILSAINRPQSGAGRKGT